MESCQKVLFVDAITGFYKMRRYALADFFGPIDLGLHLAGRLQSLNIGTGLFAGSILPGSNRLMFNGFSPCWRGFYISSMGGAGLVFDNLGINMVSLVGKAALPSILYLNRDHGEEIEVELVPVDLHEIWGGGRGGAYAMMDEALRLFGPRYEGEFRALAVGPAALATDYAGIVSAPVKDGQATHIDTWAGRGGLGSKMLAEHGIAAIVYGGTVVDEDFRDRTVADSWFEDKYKQKLAVKDFEATTKYRFDPKFQTGGTLGSITPASAAGLSPSITALMPGAKNSAWPCTSGWWSTTTSSSSMRKPSKPRARPLAASPVQRSARSSVVNSRRTTSPIRRLVHSAASSTSAPPSY